MTPDSRYVVAELYTEKAFVMLDIIEKKDVHFFEGAHNGKYFLSIFIDFLKSNDQ